MIDEQLQSRVGTVHQERIVPMVRASGEPDPHQVPVPSVADRIAAARLRGSASARSITMLTAWRGLRRELEAEGLGPRVRLEAAEWLARSDRKAGFRPDGAALWWFARDLEPGDAEAAGRRLLTDPPHGALELAATCFAAAPDATIPEALDRGALYRMPVAVGRSLLVRLDEARRRAFIESIQVRTGLGATSLLAWACHLLDLVPDDALAPVAELAREYSGSGPALAALERGAPAIGLDGVSELVRPALDLSVAAKGAAAFKAGLAAVAEHATELRVHVADASELASVEAWDAAPPTRREAVAQAVAAALGSRFRADGERVVHKRKAIRMVLMPASGGVPGPWLMAEQGLPMAVSKLKAWVFRGPFRLPTEAEWRAAPSGQPAPEICADAWSSAAPGADAPLHRAPGPRLARRGDQRLSADALDGDVVARPVVGLALPGQT